MLIPEWIEGFPFPLRFDRFTAAPAAVGGAVMLAWIALALTRGWGPEPGWVDRLGRLLGRASIAIALVGPGIRNI